MRRYMHEHELAYKVSYIPDPLCWTEAPDNLKVLGRQRNRWTRGTLETLMRHRKICFNSRYGVLGMLSYPYWLVFEWLAPIIEFMGLIYFLVMAFTGQVYWMFFLSLLGMVYCFAIFFSGVAVFSEEISFQQYKKPRDMLKLLLTCLIEPIVFHPMTVYWAIRGNLDKIRGRKTWGEMTRVGFTKKN
jgi:poly-beta-1,6-N-acetyl-D-glucosamine synthase